MITKFSPVLLAIIISMLTFVLVWRKNPHAKWIQLALCIFAFFTTTFYNLNHNYHFIFWLCNFTVLLGIGLCFRFHQTVFNVFFYFCWTGSLLTLFIFNNPVAPPMATNPVAFVGFILKHSIPIIMTIYFIRNSGHRLSENAMMSSLKYMIGYAVFIAGYNMVFDQNILDFRYPTLEIEKAFGPWPIYVIVNIALAILWYKIIDIITKKLVLIQT